MKYFMTAFFCLLCLHLSAQDKAYHGDGIDNGLRWVPVASVVVLKACGVESASSWKRLGVNALSSIALSSAVSWGLKKAVNERRPDGTDNKAFPSGHATIAFAGAHILHKEYGRLSPWISVAGYGVATATAIDRVCRNRHHCPGYPNSCAYPLSNPYSKMWIRRTHKSRDGIRYYYNLSRNLKLAVRAL